MSLKPVSLDTIESPPPKVSLASAPSAKAYDLALAAARTCYSSRPIQGSEINDRQRQELGPSIIAAGHHTPFQHASFTFVLEGVSRHFVWSFLHSHPYYNSEQQSQRYVEMSAIRARVPQGLAPETRAVFEGALRGAWSAYASLSQRLLATTRKRWAPLARVKGQDPAQAEREAGKKAIENARYLLPIAAHTTLYHTVGLLDLARYAQMAGSPDCPEESREVVGQMLALLRERDPELASRLLPAELPPLSRPEALIAPGQEPGPGDALAAEFDAELGEAGVLSALVDATPRAEAVVAQALREVLGLSRGRLEDKDALDLLLNPARNPLLLQSLNAWAQSPAMRCLTHARYVFRKRLSHTADSQDQRHRSVPASRPLLCLCHTSRPDVALPRGIGAAAGARSEYLEACARAWQAKNRLLELGVPAAQAVLVLPNALRLRFTESGDLLGLLHKWRMRTCFLAQEEIFDASLQELAAVARVHPSLAAFIGPPCRTRRGLVPDDGRRGPCPEGDRWCGVDVWLNFPKVKRLF
jgi:flavin-dependent thymidylate synthase